MVQPFLIGTNWIEVRDGDDTARAIFHRHYSFKRYKDGRRPKLFAGPGQKMVLLRPLADALFVWRKFICGDGQTGINCAVFRNEGHELSSDLIREADALAEVRWPGERHFTYVNPRRLPGTNPGYCFIKAGWNRCGITKCNKLVILELPAVAS